MEYGASILVILACLVIEAFFSGSEIAIVSASRIKLRHEAAQGSRGASIALKMLEKPEWLLSTTLIGTNIAVVANTTVATGLTIELLGEKYAWVAVLLVAPLIWIFGEIVPKSAFQQRADEITPITIFVLRFFSFVFWPILAVFAGLSWLLSRMFGGEETNPFTLREEARAMIEMSPAHGDILPGEKSMIRRVFNFSETTAGEIMVPLIEVVGIEKASTCGDAVRCAVESRHKRLPVFDGRIDRIVGSINTLDLLLEASDSPIEPFVRPVSYVPDSKGIETLLAEFSQGDVTAVVVDEFGGSEGIVMLEDVLEEVVGNLEDEFDETTLIEPAIRKMGENHYIVSARVETDTLGRRLNIDLLEGDYETLGGLLNSLVGEIPAVGQDITCGAITFTVLRATKRAVQEVRIRW